MAICSRIEFSSSFIFFSQYLQDDTRQGRNRQHWQVEWRVVIEAPQWRCECLAIATSSSMQISIMDTSHIHTRQDFVALLQAMHRDLQCNPSDWENTALLDFLEALIRYAEDIPHYYRNTGQAVNADNASWRVFADMLLGARIYE